MQIALASDAKFVKPTLVALLSLLKHASRDARVHLIGHNLSPAALDLFGRIRTVHPGVEISHHPLTDDMFPARIAGTPAVPHVTTACLCRLFIPKLIPSGRVLYVDGDTMAFRDVAELFDMDLEGKAIAAAPDINWPNVLPEDYVRGLLGEQPLSHYFNSGILLYDCDRIIAEGLDAEMAKLEMVRPDYGNPDQDRLNHVFRGRVKRLGVRWNMHLRIINYGEVYSMQRRTGQTPAIRHYISELKPWLSLPSNYFENANLLAEYGRDVLEYRRIANELLERLLGPQADILSNLPAPGAGA